MDWQKINKIETKNAETRIYLILVFLILILLALFSAVNLITVIELKKQISLTLKEAVSTNIVHKEISQDTNSLPTSDNVVATTAESGIIPISQENVISEVETKTEKPAYSNTFSEPFFSSYAIDKTNTNLVLDENVTALTFKPVYELRYEKKCVVSSCGFTEETDISSQIKMPAELNGKQIKSTSFNKLENNWVVSYIIADGNQEIGYVYLFDGQDLKPLITNKTNQRIVTKYGREDGYISAGGSDDQFVILYSGYEGIAYYYNKGVWQDLSQYFDLRVTAGGFKAKIIKGGTDKNATWYVCSDDDSKSKLIKLWQNKTDLIQGAIDISSVLKTQPVKCFYKSDREVNMVIGSSLQVFKDGGFDNSHNYYYQSSNINNYFGRKVVKIYFLSAGINATPDSCSLYVSADKEDWQKVSGTEANLESGSVDTAYLKVKFTPGGSEYSPWFSGLENVFYLAQDM